MTRVLVVDDEPGVRQALARAIKLAGLVPIEAGSADEALQKCDEHAFDVVILDFIMPDMDGIELLARIRRTQPFIRSILVSGKLDRRRGQEEIAKDLRNAVEADVYLHKPVANDALLNTIKELTAPQEERDWQQLAARIKGIDEGGLRSARKAARELKKHKVPGRSGRNG